MGNSKLEALKQRLAELTGQRAEAVKQQSVVATLTAQIEATAAEIDDLAATDAAAAREAALGKLRRREATDLAAVVQVTQTLAAALVALTDTQRAIDALQPGAADRGALWGPLAVHVTAQLEHWRKRRPQLVGAPPLLTRGQARVRDAQIALERAEQVAADFERVARAAERPLSGAADRRAALKRSVQHKRALLAWAERVQNERRPREAPPAYPYDPNALVDLSPAANRN